MIIVFSVKSWLYFFSIEMTTLRTVKELGINRNTIAKYYKKISAGILEQQDNKESNKLAKDEVELDESYFGGVRKGKRSRGN